MTPTNKCQHDGEMITGWDEVTCRKCGWIVPSGQRIGIHDGWFPSHDAHKEFKKYRTYTGMDNTYPIDATKYDEVQNMTQTNNEREIFETDDGKWDGVIRAFWRRIQGYQKCEFNDIKDLPDPLPVEFRAHFATALLNAPKELRTPTSQNEQQEAVAIYGARRLTPVGTKEFFGTLLVTDLKEGALLYTSPPKQAIPEGWKLVPIEPDFNMKQAALEWNRKNTSGTFIKVAMEYHVAEQIYKAMLNAAPTNTEVGE